MPNNSSHYIGAVLNNDERYHVTNTLIGPLDIIGDS